MADKKRAEGDCIERITSIRVKNNDLWMAIMALALKAAPEEAKKIIREIAANDAAVVLELKEISHGPKQPD